MGAMICFELARTLRRRGSPAPIRLCVAGCRAPQEPTSEPPIHPLPKDEFLDSLRHLNGTPPEVFANEELIEMALTFLRADFTLVETYTYQDEAPLSCPISAFGGADDPLVSHEQLAAWRSQTTEQDHFTLDTFPGGHFFVIDERQALIQRLIERLSQ
jgi:medium-chain acyl-[acyl-carrier-protein] hydrolase